MSKFSHKLKESEIKYGLLLLKEADKNDIPPPSQSVYVIDSTGAVYTTKMHSSNKNGLGNSQHQLVFRYCAAVVRAT
jgi:hypothetical protein